MPSPYAFVVDDQLLFDPHPKQLAIMQRLAARIQGTGPGPSKFFLYGNRGGGKSLVGRMFLHAMAVACPGLKYVVIRRNLPDLRQNHLIYLGAEIRLLGGDFHETFGQARYGNGSLGFYRCCEDERDVEKIVGAEAAIIFVDEAPQIKWDHLRTMAPSLRVPKDTATGAQPYRVCEIYSGNPVGESIEDFWKYFVDQDVSPADDPDYDPTDFEAIEIKLDDNPSLDKDEYRKQFVGLPAHFRAAWIDGVRMDARSLFDVHKTVDAAIIKKNEVFIDQRSLGKPYHYIQELPTIDGIPLLKVPWVQWYRGFDMGYFPDPAAAVYLAVIGRRILAVAEGTWFKTIAKDLAAKLTEQLIELTGSDVCAGTYVDPQINIKTGSDTVTVMDVLEMHGVACEASINDRTLYADAIHGLLGEEVEPGVPRFQIYEPGCPMLARYLPKMRWDEKHPRRMADHPFDHWVVALAYFAISSGVLANTAMETQAVRPAWMDWIGEKQRVHDRYGRRIR
jgi:hypothetical protein